MQRVGTGSAGVTLGMDSGGGGGGGGAAASSALLPGGFTGVGRPGDGPPVPRSGGGGGGGLRHFPMRSYLTFEPTSGSFDKIHAKARRALLLLFSF